MKLASILFAAFMLAAPIAGCASPSRFSADPTMTPGERGASPFLPDPSNPPRLRITNGSSAAIVSVQVSLCGQPETSVERLRTDETIAPAGEREIRAGPYRCISVDAHFADGGRDLMVWRTMWPGYRTLWFAGR